MVVEQPKKRPPHLGTIAREGGFVVVEIGPDHVRYEVHKALLTHHSEFFRAALSGIWKEAEDRKVVLEDVEPGIFNIFTNWLYTGTLPKTYPHWRELLDEDVECPAKTVELAQLKAIHFGYRILAQSFAVAAHNQYVDKLIVISAVPHYASIIYTYDMLNEHCELRDLSAELYARFWKGSWDEGDEEEIASRADVPVDFFVLSMSRFADRRDEEQCKELNRCDYHIHYSEHGKSKCAIAWESDEEDEEEEEHQEDKREGEGNNQA